MDQVSTPVRILVAAALVLAVAWFAFLKPSDDFDSASTQPVATPAATASATSTPSSDAGAAKALAEKARDTASSDANRAAGTTESGTTAPVASPDATPSAAATDASPEDAAIARLPQKLRTALRKQRVVVLVVSNGRSVDDKAVEKAARRAARQQHGSAAFVADIDHIDRYAPITRGANVLQSPTTIVVDADRKVETLVGYVDAETIEQAVVDARRAGRESGGATTAERKYIAAMEKACNGAFDRANLVLGSQLLDSKAEAKRRVAEAVNEVDTLVGQAKAVDPPAAFKVAHVRMLRFLDEQVAVIHRQRDAVKAWDLAALVALNDDVERLIAKSRAEARAYSVTGVVGCV